jgi:hypothetical protein
MARFTYANVMSTLAVLIALAGSTSAIAAVIISDNDQVAQNTISGHAPPSGKHANLIAGSVNGTDLSATYKANQKTRCPADMHRTADLCIEVGLRAAQPYAAALATCALAGRRVPDQGEAAQALNNLAANQPAVWAQGDYRDAVSGGHLAPLEGSSSSREILFGTAAVDLAQPFRCVSTPMN